MNPLLVISFYDRRPLEPLVTLLDSLDRHPAGIHAPRVICVNSTGSQRLPPEIVRRVDDVLERPNVGMNLGAWDAAWRRWTHDAYVFVQDECYAVREGWMATIADRLRRPDTGLVGEALNAAWDRPWGELRETVGRDRLAEHLIDGREANRVDVYLHHLQRYGIDPGDTGRHLRSLVLAARRDVLERIDGFRSGADYGECIAAEIGASRAVEALGLALVQVADSPFHVFRHLEWNQDRPGGPFAHKAVMLRQLQQLREENRVLRERFQNPTFGDIGGLLRRRLSRAWRGGA